MALIKYIPIAPNLNLLGWRWFFIALAIVIVVGTGATLAIKGLNLGVDFRGGIVIEIQTKAPADLADLRDRLNALNLGEVTLQQFGDPTDVLISLSRQEGEEAGQIQAIETVKAALGDEVQEYRRTEFVGPKVGSELQRDAILATALAMLGIAVYIWFRFEWQFAVASLIALLHDVIGTVGFYAVTGFEFNLTSVAAVLTVAGYSVNDTVVIFDRVRETLRKYKKLPLPELLNDAINSTLSRTFLTSVTTLIALIALAAFGGEVLRGFSIAMIIGIVLGTYSSFGVATPLLIWLGLRQSSMTVEQDTKAGAGSGDSRGTPRAS
ncbi:MAG: protein translocase subunit SecF [Kiloniellales bacterium]